MQKAWKVMGVSTVKPEGLPKAFTVVEKEIGEVYQVDALRGAGKVNFVETPKGDIVIYREGVQGSGWSIPHGQMIGLVQFLARIYNEHLTEDCKHGVKMFSKCPGTPHRGHASSDWSCPLDV